MRYTCTAQQNSSFLIPKIMVERFLSQTSFTTQEDFIKNFKINVPENFNFGYDVVDAWATVYVCRHETLYGHDSFVFPKPRHRSW